MTGSSFKLGCAGRKVVDFPLPPRLDTENKISHIITMEFIVNLIPLSDSYEKHEQYSCKLWSDCNNKLDNKPNF